MNEAYLKKRLKEALKKALPGCVVVRHEDKFSAGVPDMSVTWAGVTSWVEVKYQRTGRKVPPTALQELTLVGLAATGAPAYLVTYVAADLKRKRRATVLVHDYHVPSVSAAVDDHYGVARLIHDDHLRRKADAELVRDFMTKFEVPMRQVPKFDTAVARRRYDHLSEEMGELFRAINQQDLVETADAAVDIVYVAIGLALELGVPWPEIFREVHAANMRKVRAVSVLVDEDGNAVLLNLGVAKPPEGKKLMIHKPNGWKGPDVAGVLRRAGWKV